MEIAAEVALPCLVKVKQRLGPPSLSLHALPRLLYSSAELGSSLQVCSLSTDILDLACDSPDLQLLELPSV